MDYNETENYIAEAIHSWVWSGFYDGERVNEMLDDILEDDVDEMKMRELISQEFSEKNKQEKEWATTTDCDRLDAVFTELNSKMIIAIQNTGYTTSDGHDDVSDVQSQLPNGTYRGYCFYHGQDVERAVIGGGLMLAFGDMKDTDEGKIAIAETITQTLQKHGLAFEWEGQVDKRINISRIHWQRRFRSS